MRNETGFTLIEVLICIVIIALIIPVIGLSVYGIYVAFSASIIVGIVSLIIEPSPLVIGGLMLFADYNLPEKLVEVLGLPF